ncbi:hypothetical protein K402DRAFT_79741 [Aulographum hederae CBS 113979]|uniref:Uncharacterized protein n=1 Tax=Aulographum hederae CBS 113979 TaxID=1176131 RepID=A0A6G1HGB7_9PEZI|nr:hypothetical protein K402DRAFT_79741 [Aulographum hederae CBS 113979]
MCVPPKPQWGISIYPNSNVNPFFLSTSNQKTETEIGTSPYLPEEKVNTPTTRHPWMKMNMCWISTRKNEDEETPKPPKLCGTLNPPPQHPLSQHKTPQCTPPCPCLRPNLCPACLFATATGVALAPACSLSLRWLRQYCQLGFQPHSLVPSEAGEGEGEAEAGRAAGEEGIEGDAGDGAATEGEGETAAAEAAGKEGLKTGADAERRREDAVRDYKEVKCQRCAKTRP